MSLKIVYYKFVSNLPGVNELIVFIVIMFSGKRPTQTTPTSWDPPGTVAHATLRTAAGSTPYHAQTSPHHGATLTQIQRYESKPNAEFLWET